MAGSRPSGKILYPAPDNVQKAQTEDRALPQNYDGIRSGIESMLLDLSRELALLSTNSPDTLRAKPSLEDFL